MEVLKSFPPINGLFIPHEQMRIKNDFLPMEFRMRILMPNETLKRFHSPIKLDDSPNINGIGGFILFPILNVLMGLLSSIMINFVCSTLTS
jgi:hypothetical protein